MLSEFGQYTIEALIVFLLCMVFTLPYNDNLMIRFASLVDQLDTNVRSQALLLKSRRCKQSFSKVREEVKKSGSGDKYTIGSKLVSFMVERELIKLISCDLSGSVRAIKKKKESYFLPSHLYAVCNFDISLLPIKFILPMVYKLVDWVCARGIGHKPRHPSDLSGGYLSSITGEIYNRYRLLSSGDINHFYIDIQKKLRGSVRCNEQAATSGLSNQQ